MGASRLRLADPDEVAQENALRSETLDWLAAQGVERVFGGEKVDGRGLSPGCRTCGEGAWSCLFVNGRCNADCFYCPSPQDDESVPTTGGIPFADPDEYAEYVERFGYRGVGLSGGEPLLTFDRTLALARAVKERLGDAVHLWLYTNGRLATEDRLRALAGAGLDEIRFDATAGVARDGALRDAARLLPRVTVEIPCVPGTLDLLVTLARDLARKGVRHLNLHQLRATPHNAPRLAPLGLRFRDEGALLALGSETTALSLLRRTLEDRIPIAVNACTFRYKSAAQERGTRLRAAPFIRRPDEEIDADGFLRGPVEGEVAAARALPRPTFSAPFVEVRLSTGRKITVERLRKGAISDSPGGLARDAGFSAERASPEGECGGCGGVRPPLRPKAAI